MKNIEISTFLLSRSVVEKKNLQDDDEEEDTARDVDLVASENHCDGTKLSDKVNHHKKCGKKP